MVEQLDLWTLLEAASAVPEEAEFKPIWCALDLALSELEIQSRLQIAAEAISKAADIFQVRAWSIFEEMEAATGEDGPIMPEDAFDRYVRQYMTIDFDEYIEEPEVFARMPRTVEEVQSVVEIVDKETLLESLPDESLSEEEAYAEAIALAHHEDVSVWIAAIAEHLPPGEIEFLDLLKLVNLAPIEVWLGLLLGGFCICRNEKELDFYSSRILISSDLTQSNLAYSSFRPDVL
jgi:hypothetical protein